MKKCGILCHNIPTPMVVLFLGDYGSLLAIVYDLAFCIQLVNLILFPSNFTLAKRQELSWTGLGTSRLATSF